MPEKPSPPSEEPSPPSERVESMLRSLASEDERLVLETTSITGGFEAMLFYEGAKRKGVTVSVEDFDKRAGYIDVLGKGRTIYQHEGTIRTDGPESKIRNSLRL